MSGWRVKNLLQHNELLKAMQNDQKRYNRDHSFLNFHQRRQEQDKNVEWFKKKLTKLLNKYAKIMQITSYSKQWQNKKVVKARLTWAKEKKSLGRNKDLKEELK